MATIVVEHSFPDGSDPEALLDAERRLASKDMQVLRLLSARDKRHMVSLFDAPSTTSVEQALSAAGVPFTDVWETRCLIPWLEDPTPPAGMSTIIVQRNFLEPMTVEQIRQSSRDGAECRKLYRADIVQSFLGIDGCHMCCYFQGPDADTVRRVEDNGPITYVRAWVANVFDPSAP